MGRVVSSRSKKTDDWMGRARLIIEQRGLTYDDLAPALEVGSRSAVGHYLAGRRELSAYQAVKLAERLGCRVEWLLTGKLPVECESEAVNRPLPLSEFSRRLSELPPIAYSAIAQLVTLMTDTPRNGNVERTKKRLEKKKISS